MEHAFHLLLLESFFRNNRHIQKQITAAGLFPGQPKILEFLLTHDGCSQKEIGIGCILDKSSVTSLVKRMEKTRLVYKKQDTQDQRAFHIFLTSTGKEKARWVQQTLQAVDRHALQGISPKEQAAFIHTFQKIIANQTKWDDMPK